jgi:signal transduction histidine kinase
LIHSAEGQKDAWISERVAQHRSPGRPLVQRRTDDTWIRINERQTEDGGTVGVYTDITELKRREEELEQARDTAQQATEAKSRFLANMSHELRTPLNAIIGYSEMLQEEARDQNAEGFVPDLQRINAAGKHLLELINGVLDLSKIEAGRWSSTWKPSRLGRSCATLRRCSSPSPRRTRTASRSSAPRTSGPCART